MSEKSKVFQRHQWLISLIQRSGSISFQEIQNAWERSPLNVHGTPLTLRTFHRHRNEIKDIFGIDIACDKSDNTYYIYNTGEMESNGVQSWMLSTIAVDSMLNESRDLRERIQFENIPGGQEHLSTIIEAMRENKVLNMTYHNFKKGTEAFVPLEPYFIKVFEQRWYVIGRALSHAEDDVPRVYALDRITDLEMSQISFAYPKDFDPEEFYNYSYGVFRMNEKPELIRLKVKQRLAQYLDSLPIHHSQEKVESNEDYSIYTLFLTPALDFIQYICSQGSDIEVLEPVSLRARLAEEFAILHQMYSQHTVQK